jgi:ATP phosphoribosyltransferase
VARLTVALPKGRLFNESLALFRKLGATELDELANSRRLLVDDPGMGLRFLAVKAPDVPVYVEYGAADLGIVGRDLLEEGQFGVYHPLGLGFGRCRLVVAVPRDRKGTAWQSQSSLRVATKYPYLARQHFLNQGISAEILRVSGSVELAPRAGLADVIVDVVDSGRTLRENGLVEAEEILASEAILIVNRASHKVYFQQIGELLERNGRVV